MKSKQVIDSDQEYDKVLSEVFTLMNRGEDNLTHIEIERLAYLVPAIETYEDEILNLKPIK